MNFEYKVGYLWKYHEEDPGQQSWIREGLRKPLGRNVESARADLLNFAHRQSFASGVQLWGWFWQIRRFRLLFSQDSKEKFHFTFFPFLFLLLLFPSPLFSSLSFCWLLDLGFWRGSSARIRKVKAGKLSGLAESFADVCRKLRFEVPAQIQYKIL